MSKICGRKWVVNVHSEAELLQCHAVPLEEFLNDKASVTKLAYQYWLRRGSPKGSPETDWFKAEREIDLMLIANLELGLPA